MLNSRSKRYNALVNNLGFLPVEAKELSTITTMTPYIRQLIKDRYAMYLVHKEQKTTTAEYNKNIVNIYIDRGWLSNSKSLGKKLDDKAVYRLLRFYENLYRMDYPEYESDTIGVKGRNNMTSAEFQRKLNNTIANQLKRDNMYQGKLFNVYRKHYEK